MIDTGPQGRTQTCTATIGGQFKNDTGTNPEKSRTTEPDAFCTPLLYSN